MRTCASCGKANNPIRKYCTRCGKSLISVEEKPASPTPTSVITETQIPDIQPTESVSDAGHVRSDSVKATTDDEWVRPSQVSRDRVRSGSSSSGKSEFEKAKEAFARAEGVGIEEAAGSGIVETRMLRASEIRELMGEGAVISQEPAPHTPPAPQVVPTPQHAVPTKPAPAPATPTPTPTDPPAAPSTPPIAASTPKPATITTPAAPTPSTIPTMPTTNKSEPVATSAPSVPTPPPTTPVKPPTPQPTISSAASITLDDKIPEIEEVLSTVSEKEDLEDSKVKDLIAILTTQHAELRKVKEDMTNVSARLDEFVRSCMNDAEVKRIHYESLCEQERFAKQEYESSKKEYERVDKRRKKEVSSLEDKVKNVEKNIAKSEDNLKKRIEELDKVREKITQLQSDDA